MYRALGFLLALLLAFPALGDVVVKSGATSDQLTVDATSKAARVAGPYDSSARELYTPISTYMVPIEIRHTAATAAGVKWFDLAGPPSKTAYVKRIYGQVCFDGVGLAATGTMRIGLYRGTGAATATGGTAIVPIKKNSAFATSTVADVRSVLAGTTLTTTGITYDTVPFYVVGLPGMAVQVAAPATSGDSGGCVPVDLQFCQPYQPIDDCLLIKTNEHLAMGQQTVAAVIGLTFMGFMEWGER